MRTKQVKVLRSFYMQGKLHEKGGVVELPLYFAREMIAAGKAEEFVPKPEVKEEVKEEVKPKQEEPELKDEPAFTPRPRGRPRNVG